MRQVKVTVFPVSAAPAGSDVSSGFGFRPAGEQEQIQILKSQSSPVFDKSLSNCLKQLKQKTVSVEIRILDALNRSEYQLHQKCL